jgi:FHS family Na+ dependent glucose MFS transporter 1
MNRDGRLSKTVGYYAAFVVFGGATAALGPTLPALAGHVQVTLRAISILFTARSLGYLVGALSGGRVYDRLPGHPVLAGLLVLLAAALAVVPLPGILWLLAPIMLVLGLAEGGIEVGANALLLWVHRDKAGPLVNGLHFFFGVGAFLSPIAVAWTAAHLGDGTSAYWLLAVLALPVALWIVRLPSPARPAETAADGRVVPVDYVLVALVTLFFFLYAGIEHSFGGWIYTYSTARQLATESAAAYLTSVFWGAITMGRLLAIPLALRIRPAALILADLAGVLVSLSLFSILPTSPQAAWIATIGLGLSLASIVPSTLAFVGQRMAVTGLATGWFFVGLGLGAMTIPLLIGQLFEGIGPWTMPLVLTVDLALAFGLFLVLLRYAARYAPREIEGVQA